MNTARTGGCGASPGQLRAIDLADRFIARAFGHGKSTPFEIHRRLYPSREGESVCSGKSPGSRAGPYIFGVPGSSTNCRRGKPSSRTSCSRCWRPKPWRREAEEPGRCTTWKVGLTALCRCYPHPVGGAKARGEKSPGRWPCSRKSLIDEPFAALDAPDPAQDAGELLLLWEGCVSPCCSSPTLHRGSAGGG